MNRAQAHFPVRHLKAMYQAIVHGKEGEVAQAKKNAEQVWQYNLHALLASIDMQEEMRREAHPAACKILQKYGRECKTRIRPYKHRYNGNINGRGQCAQNSVLEALDTGMELWSGYAFFAGEMGWHLWNVDGQGFVHDSTYGANSMFCRYYGVRLDPYAAYEVAVARSRRGCLEGIFLYWNLFGAFQRNLRKYVGAKVDDEFFAKFAELIFIEKIAIV